MLADTEISYTLVKIKLKNLPRYVSTGLALAFPLGHGRAVQGIPGEPRVWDTDKDQKD